MAYRDSVDSLCYMGKAKELDNEKANKVKASGDLEEVQGAADLVAAAARIEHAVSAVAAEDAAKKTKVPSKRTTCMVAGLAAKRPRFAAAPAAA